MPPASQTPPALKAGAALFALWSVLHIWVPLEGYRVYLADGVAGTTHMLTGGSAVPHGSYKLPADAATTLAQGRLFLNFVTDVGGYGVLGLVVAHGLWTNRNGSCCCLLYILLAYVLTRPCLQLGYALRWASFASESRTWPSSFSWCCRA